MNKIKFPNELWDFLTLTLGITLVIIIIKFLSGGEISNSVVLGVIMYYGINNLNAGG